MVICTALVPGRPAPRLISEAMLDALRPGSVLVDLAVAQGGNCAGTVAGETVIRNGVTLIGADALPSSVPHHASALYARNLAALLEHVLDSAGSEFVPSEPLPFNLEDPIVDGCLFIHGGSCRRPDVLGIGGAA
jgi:NAD(P) transhydrogenase subunit alpha